MNILCFIITLALSFSAHSQEAELEKATFAGGCFWCMEPPFEKIEGVKSVISGFSGGVKKNPSYKSVATGKTNHIECVQVTYDPKKIKYRDLLEIYWRQINPTDEGGQFIDRGQQYSTAIFYHNKEQHRQAFESKQKLQKSNRFDEKIVTKIRAFKTFYPAENYHQDYYKKKSLKYKYYRIRSGRDSYLDKTWGKERVYTINNKMN